MDSIGPAPGGFRADFEAGALPTVRTRLLDLLLEPYFRGWLNAGGTNVSAMGLKEKAGWDAWTTLRPALEPHRFTGVYQCTRRGIQQLHGIDIHRMDRRDLDKLDASIGHRYTKLFTWYREAMQRAHFSKLIRIVHPEFYSTPSNAAAAAEEKAFTRTIMRIDPFVTLDNSDTPRRRTLAAIAGVDARDATSWRKFLEAHFTRAAEAGALGIKQLQAYRRNLDYAPRSDNEIRWSGTRTPQETLAFQDWVVHECCKLAAARGWVHQIHVGTNNLPHSNPLPLAALAQRYRAMKIVMIHCWPFLREAGWLAKFHPNVYIDTCWQPVLNPNYFREAIATWWNYIPYHKIMCSHDSTTVEMAVGSSLFTREILLETLTERRYGMGAPPQDLRQAAAALLHDNAAGVYAAG
ncbi:MAG: amidohydrolase family protein [Acidobacteria bacterium]|nr:amidohydrolase family protein [Acidobacteriota bacterium]